MREGNVRVQPEKVGISLDGRQIASVVVGALVIFAMVFVLGVNVGRQIGARQAASAHTGSLDALDRAPSGQAVSEPALTFHDRLTKAKPDVGSNPPTAGGTAAAPRAEKAPPAEPSPAPAPLVQKEAPSAVAPAQGAVEVAPANPVAPPAPAVPKAEDFPRPAAGTFTIQVGASPDRVEADRLAARFEAFRPRVESAEVGGRRVFRVRVGSFETKEGASRYLNDLTRETGARGWVTSSR